MMNKACLLVLAATALAQDTWNWDQCDAANGPANWPGACKNQLNGGTPINLCAAQAYPGTLPSFVTNGYDALRTLDIVSDGKSVQINIVDNFPWMQAGALSSVVGRGTNTSTHNWMLGQMHLHWGRTGLVNEGSEHYLQGKRYPLEAHFVHYNAQYSGVGAAAGSGKPDSLLVVGYFLDVDNRDLGLMKAIGDAVSTASATPKPMSSQQKLTDLFSLSGDYYTYGGSLTTPTCLEQVTWIVMKEVKPITLQTLENIKKAVKADGTLVSKYGNYRPIQPLGNRKLYISSGPSAACGALSEPVWVCQKAGGSGNSGLLSSPSILCQLLALCVAFFFAQK